MEIARVEAGEGANWYVRGWRLFVKKPVFWVLIFLAPLAAAVLLFWALPLLGSLAVSLLGPVIGAGLYQAARTADEGGEPDLSMLFAGFSRQETRTPLLILGVIALAVAFAADMLSRRLIGSAFLDMDMGDGMPMPHAGLGSLFALLIVLAVEIAVAFAFFYAVPLVWFKGVAPVEAIKASFSAGVANFAPLLLFGLIGAVLTVLAVLPLMLGMLLLLPVMFLAMYSSYRSIFPG